MPLPLRSEAFLCTKLQHNTVYVALETQRRREFIRMETEQITKEIGVEERQAEPSPEKKERFFTVWNIIGIILCVLFLPGFIISTTLLVSSLIHPDVPPSCFGYTPLMVETGTVRRRGPDTGQ